METSISGEPASPHHVGIAIRAVVFSALLAGAAGTLLLWGVRTLQQGGSVVSTPSPPSDVFALLVASLLGTPAIAALSTWWLTRPLISPWRRGGFSAVAGGSGLLVVLVAAVADNLGGRIGLLIYAGLCVVLSVLLSRRVAEGRHAT